MLARKYGWAQRLFAGSGWLRTHETRPAPPDQPPTQPEPGPERSPGFGVSRRRYFPDFSRALAID